MNNPLFSLPSKRILFIVVFLSSLLLNAQVNVFDGKYILNKMYSVYDFQMKNSGLFENRNWNRSTFYTGVMAFYQVSQDPGILAQAIAWSDRNDWKVGNEIFFPANRLTCTQTYLQLFFEKHDSLMIIHTRAYLDAERMVTEPAYLRGWYYADAFFVGIPPFMMMSAITKNNQYAEFGNRIFWELADQLFDKEEKLFYRDSESRFNEKSKNSKKVIWSRGNGWVMASLPRILTYLENDNTYYSQYAELLKEMAESLKQRQGQDGLWRTNLADAEEFPEPESSGTAFFVYAMAWGINNGLLNRDEFEPVVNKAWTGLCSIVGDDGKVCWGQPEARKPGKVKKEDSNEFVAGAFLLAASEMFRMTEKPKE